MNIEKYKNSGWGLSKLGLQKLLEILDNFTNARIIEFGSGKSTEFFNDYIIETNKNNFYEIKNNEITGTYDLVVLDGPNGNGRRIAFLYLINHLRNGTFVFIDDYTHYDFIERFGQLFDYEIYFEHTSGMINQWQNGGDFIILKIINDENI